MNVIYFYGRKDKVRPIFLFLDDLKKAPLNPQNLIELAHYKMPFGKYKDRYLVDIPEYYYTWFRQKGFPEGKLGRLMQEMNEIKINGLEPLILKIRREYPAPPPSSRASKDSLKKP